VPPPKASGSRGPSAAERAAAERARKLAEAVKAAEAALASAQAKEHETRAAWEDAHEALLTARRELKEIQARSI
jgi:hypothetical protein